MSPSVFHLFGYGSLITSPEYGETVISRGWGVLSGHRRAFNKRSPGRGCPAEDAWDAFSDVPDGFRSARWVQSLAVGTEPSPGGRLVGLVLAYPRSHEARVLADTDRREGYDAAVDVAREGYLRASVRIEPLASPSEQPAAVDAWTYLSNPAGDYHVPESVPLATRARMLINATPRPGTASSTDGHARGLGYLEGIRAALRVLGEVDSSLEALARAVYALPGEWTTLLRPPESH